ncbi:dCMP deaminase family protein [Patescibacteria group bacterium]|nr:dCMP deaminase family protein [Patescibacteria group bacterium]
MKVNKRISHDEYFMCIAKVVCLRSTCLRHNIGCVIVKDNVIISTGYNGAVKSSEHCIDIGCIRNEMNIPSGTRIETCRAVHAEQNALLQAGSNAQDSILYVNATPCITCCKLMVNAGIKKIVIPKNDSYPDKDGIIILRNVNITIVELDLQKGCN